MGNIHEHRNNKNKQKNKTKHNLGMASVMLNDTISKADLDKHREAFQSIKMPDENQQFQFAVNLIRSARSEDVDEGLRMFQTLFSSTRDEDIKRDSLYYMAVAQTKLNQYEQALKYLNAILKIQPNNDQVKELKSEVERRMRNDGLLGVGIVGGAALTGILGLVPLGAAMIAKKK